ncbi:MAG TPA: bifunctional hydroxymethylpyrimidine kinase/phosphomethylpyrimidine kinase [Acetobacteraceae bacterium]|nr:bifunctional hydroxymethylpyrimidine kinase/phosphomethylpyrimidine kinase [Acetobacteraceae bacterium]
MKGRVLVIAGSDSGGGAGIQADIKSVMAMGGYAATAITALTAQNTLGVHGVHPVPVEFLRQQIAVVLEDIGADAIKTGMLGDAAIIEAVADELIRRAPGVPLVVDPVMVAKGGAPLLAETAVAALRDRLLPLASLITPNLPEAEALLGRPVTDVAEGAAALLQTGAHSVLLKGGHAEGPTCMDALATEDGIEYLEMPRILTRHTHGTGCTLASAIAAGLAQGLPLSAAVRRARAYVQEAIRTAPGFGRGHGPLNHLAAIPAGSPPPVSTPPSRDAP